MLLWLMVAPFLIVEGGKPSATILLGSRATPLERHAAEELRKYVRLMSGAELPIRSGALPPGDCILIGRPKTNKHIARLAESGAIGLSPTFPGLDGFVIKVVPLERGRALVLGGSQDRGTLYGSTNCSSGASRWASSGIARGSPRCPLSPSRLTLRW